MRWVWPLAYSPRVFPDAPGRFGAVRKHDIHTGVDLYTEPGTPVHAVEDGMVVAIENFTGPSVGSPWWLETKAILVEGLSGVVCYGEVEIAEGISVGAAVPRAVRLGVVAPVLRKDKGRPTTMLHLELYESGTRASVVWTLGCSMPKGLRDPTAFLLDAMGESL
jgi:murein DD-endopeptidase MepM/ murein hydrolase activator NlpD